MKIVIVESPNKIAKIGKILGSEFKVMASMGHIRDLPGDKMAVDLKNGYRPEYKVTKLKVVSELRNACKNASCVYIATDPDREGEGIAMHLIQVLNLKFPKYRRMTFNEITPRAVKQALVEADRHGNLNFDMADAYQARRIVDRVVGYTVSPFLWNHVRGAKSAGRVQSVTTRLVIDRENLIKEHIPEEKYMIKGEFEVTEEDKAGEKFEAKLEQIPKTEDEAKAVLDFCKEAEFSVDECKTKIVLHSPPAPYKTSVFQQDAGKRYNISPKQAMSIAQKLYEKGKITYHRTDVTRLSDYFMGQAKEYLENKYGSEYLSDKLKKFTPTPEGEEVEKKTKPKKQGEQAAHEAIRPTDINQPFLIGDHPDIEKKVYNMIWVRAVASLMAKEKCRRYEAKVIMDNTDDYWFLASHLVTLFKGFKILTDSESEVKESIISQLEELDDLKYLKIESKQTFTEPPKRYTESALVKELENKGIGRPSTYANIIDTVQKRKYVQNKNDTPTKKNCVHSTLEDGKVVTKSVQMTFGDKKKRLFATDLGLKVTEFLVGSLDTLMNYEFTRNLETDLDNVANGNARWQDVVGNVHTTMDTKMKAVPDRPPLTEEEKKERKQKKMERVVGSYEGKPMEFFTGQYGPFIKHDGKCYSLPKEQGIEEAKDVTEEMAIKAIEYKRTMNDGIVSFECKLGLRDGSLKVLKGQYGYYLKFFPKKGKPRKDDNYFLPKEMKEDLEAVATLKLEDCLQYVDNTLKYRESKKNWKKSSKK